MAETHRVETKGTRALYGSYSTGKKKFKLSPDQLSRMEKAMGASRKMHTSFALSEQQKRTVNKHAKDVFALMKEVNAKKSQKLLNKNYNANQMLPNEAFLGNRITEGQMGQIQAKLATKLAKESTAAAKLKFVSKYAKLKAKEKAKPNWAIERESFGGKQAWAARKRSIAGQAGLSALQAAKDYRSLRKGSKTRRLAAPYRSASFDLEKGELVHRTSVPWGQTKRGKPKKLPEKKKITISHAEHEHHLAWDKGFPELKKKREEEQARIAAMAAAEAKRHKE
jgi:hypothetical protein